MNILKVKILKTQNCTIFYVYDVPWNFIAITPVFTALLCWILGRETLTLLQWLGIGLSIFGLVLTQSTGGLRVRRLFLKRRFIR